MKKLIILILLVCSVAVHAQDKKRALLIVDIQNFYYPGGKAELYQPEKAGENAKLVLEHFREVGDLVVHIRHNFEPGGEIHAVVAPIEGEKVISKNQVNSFRDTDLQEYLQEHGITELVIVGMQTHMCIEAATRAAADLGYNTTVIEDACTTRDLKYGDNTVKAMDVHYSTLATLRSYAKVTTLKDFFHLK
ncbi:MAG: cysteine hydrolase [Bacteroidetes bacterium]|nr:cysteine hydrolase [Bacteroidota bacterium]